MAAEASDAASCCSRFLLRRLHAEGSHHQGVGPGAARRIKNETGLGGSAPGVQRDVARLILHAQGSQWAEILFDTAQARAAQHVDTR
ncbi:MAG: hypothetical protein M3Q65_00785, partial [Chloroflexota bacterium]|nr:hypothetical protein [Chloroflexota bacterium]